MLTVAVLLGTTAVVGSSGLAAAKSTAPVKKLAESSTAIYKIEPKETTGAPPGCVNGCPTVKTNTPSFIAQDENFAAIAGASKIDTFPVNLGCGPGGCSTTQSGCAIVAGVLWCWGSNSSGQLGTGNTTDATAPTKSLDGGQPLSGVTDLSANGQTTCIVDDGAVRCVGSGNFSSYKSVMRSITEMTTTYSSPTSYSSSNSSRCESDKVDSDGNVVSTSNSCGMSSTSSTAWQTIVPAGAVKVQVGANAQTPPICVLMTTGKVDCLLSATSLSTFPPQSPGSSTSSTTSYDCDGNSADYESSTYCMGPSFPTRHRTITTSTSESPAVKLNWQTVSGITNAVDISMPSDSWGASSLCIAANGAATCRTFLNGTIGKATTIKNSEGAEAVWITSGWGPTGLCVYAAGTMKCGAGTSGPTGQSMATSVTPVAVMEKPLSVFYGALSNMSKIYFLLPSGVLSADSWVFSCSGCYSTANSVVAPVTAFTEAAAKSFFALDGVTGATDSAEFIPLRLKTGTRGSRSGVQVTLKAGTEVLTSATVKWMAPDYPGQYQSSASSSLTSDANGVVKTSSGSSGISLVSGPITFTISGGSLASGATLQAASVTVLVPDSGPVEVSVPLPSPIIQRKVNVVLPGGQPVPNAKVTLQNNYLTYAYANAGGSTSSWSSQKKDTRGYFAQTNCAYCYAPPPAFSTGADGSITFPSFNTASRSTSYDADVSYDDGELNQNVQTTFTSTETTVEMTFMPNIQLQTADADKSTSDVDVAAGADGRAEIVIQGQSEDGAATGKEVSVEEVCAAIDSGGLVGSSTKVDNLCSSVSSSSVVSALGVKSFACKGSSKASTDAKGKATLKLCPSSSTRVRVRGQGLLASKIVCVRVKGAPCRVASPGSGGSSGAAPKSVKAKGKIATTQFLKAFTAKSGAGAIKTTASGACKIVGKNVVAGTKKGVCRVTIVQAAKGKVKGSKKVFSVKVT